MNSNGQQPRPRHKPAVILNLFLLLLMFLEHVNTERARGPKKSYWITPTEMWIDIFIVQN